MEFRTKSSATDEIEKEIHHVHQIRGDVGDQIHHCRCSHVRVEISKDVNIAFHRLPTLDEDAKKDQQIVDGIGQRQNEERDGDGD